MKPANTGHWVVRAVRFVSKRSSAPVRRGGSAYPAKGQGRRAAWMLAATLLAGGATGAAHAASDAIGANLPLLTSPFWQAYNNYLPQYAKQLGLDMLAPVNSNGDPAQQITDINNLLNQGVKGIVTGPLDSAAISRALAAASAKHVPVVAVDVAPTQGKVAMVVRADNRAYGEKACTYIGDHVSAG